MTNRTRRFLNAFGWRNKLFENSNDVWQQNTRHCSESIGDFKFDIVDVIELEAAYPLPARGVYDFDLMVVDVLESVFVFSLPKSFDS